DLFRKCESLGNVRQAKEWGLYPYFHQMSSKQDTEVTMEGKKIVMIGSNNYLGLTSHPAVIAAGKEALDRYGTGCSGSRFLNGTLTEHVALERELADFRKEDAVTFSTGFQSNLGIISALAGRNDVILCDKENHASIYDACRLSYAKMVRYRHSDMADLEERLKEIDLSVSGVLIVTDGVFSMSGEICKLPEIIALARRYGARVMVDDAHGLGVLGEKGKGTAEYFGLEEETDLYMGTFPNPWQVSADIWRRIGASAIREALPALYFQCVHHPASVACARARELHPGPERVRALAKNAEYMRSGLKARAFPDRGVTPIIPIYTYEDKKAFLHVNFL
ncbi:MAG: aminotransferase class I/II-fold pyridoxal phosphate-dependent enzyme, partial [Christensenellaceae bacterium]